MRRNEGGGGGGGTKHTARWLLFYILLRLCMKGLVAAGTFEVQQTRMDRKLVVGLAALAALCALVAARSDVGLPGCATFTYPMLQKANGITVPLDHCLNTTKECGEVVAHNFCQLHNYNTAVAFKRSTSRWGGSSFGTISPPVPFCPWRGRRVKTAG